MVLSESGNAASMVLQAEYGNFSMLLTGDVEGAGEKQLVKSGRLGKCRILKAAHHGSKNSGTEEFLDAVEPQIVLISAGRGNRYGHPLAGNSIPPIGSFHIGAAITDTGSFWVKNNTVHKVSSHYRYALPFVRNGIHRRYILGKH